MQRTLAVELQKLSIQFRKQQKAYLNRLRSKDGNGSGAAALGLAEGGGRGREEEDLDLGFSDLQSLKVGRARGQAPCSRGAGERWRHRSPAGQRERKPCVPDNFAPHP